MTTPNYQGRVSGLTRITIDQFTHCWIYYADIEGREDSEKFVWSNKLKIKPDEVGHNIIESSTFWPKERVFFAIAFPHVTRMLGWTIEDNIYETNINEFARYDTETWEEKEFMPKNPKTHFLVCPQELKITNFEDDIYGLSPTIPQYYNHPRSINAVPQARIINPNKLKEWYNEKKLILKL